MNACERFLARLDALLEGRLEDDERRYLTAHADDCPDCSAIWTICRDPAAGSPPPDDAGLTAAILAATGHDACGAARRRAVDARDDALAPLDRRLLEEHVDDCPACRRFAATLVELEQALPELAEPDPGPGFTASVLARTSRMRVPRTPRWWRRPRLAMELAYAATLLLAASVALPGSPLAGAPERIHRWARGLGAPMVTFESTIHGGMERMVNVTGNGLRRTRAEARRGLVDRTDRWWPAMHRELGTLWTEVASEEATSGSGPSERDGVTLEEIHDERDPGTSL